jgi:glutathione peroxidase
VPGLIALGRKYADHGLCLLFFPCNQFCSEEPGSAAEISAFYVDRHGLPASSLMERADVNGPRTQDAYKFLRSADGGGTADGAIEWNFTKFVVGRDGQVLGRYPQGAKPPFFDQHMPAWLG